LTYDNCLENPVLGVNETMDDNNNPNGMLVKNGSTVYVVFRGTADLTDALADAVISLVNFQFKDGDHMCVHSGFMDSVAEKMDYLLFHESLITSASKIVITGHSLGGAMSTIYTS